MNQEITLIENESRTVAEQVKSLSVVDQKTYENGASLKIALLGLKKKIEIYWNPKVSKCKEAYDTIRASRDEMLKPTTALDSEVKVKLKTYEREMEKKAEEARRKAEEEKQKKIEEENKKRQQEAEVFGEDKAEEVNPDEIEIEQPLPTINRVKGLGIRKVWKWKVVDINKVPREYFILDEMLINKEARGLKDKLNIPGIEAYED